MAPPNTHGLDAATLKQLMRYDPLTGQFYTIKVRAGSNGRVGWVDGHGYVAICILRKHHRAHRLAWLYTYGEWPTELDHINGDRADNRLSNLRVASRRMNLGNRGAVHPSRHKKGVVQHASGKWIAQILSSPRKEYLGSYDTEDEAHEAYKRAATRVFGEFARFE